MILNTVSQKQIDEINSNLSNFDWSETSMEQTDFKSMMQQILNKVFPRKFHIIKNGVLQGGITFNTQLNHNTTTFSQGASSYDIKTVGSGSGLSTNVIANTNYTKLILDISCTSTNSRFVNATGIYGQGLSIPNSRSLVEIDISELQNVILSVSGWNAENNISIYNAYLEY